MPSFTLEVDCRNRDEMDITICNLQAFLGRGEFVYSSCCNKNASCESVHLKTQVQPSPEVLALQQRVQQLQEQMMHEREFHRRVNLQNRLEEMQQQPDQRTPPPRPPPFTVPLSILNRGRGGFPAPDEED